MKTNSNAHSANNSGHRSPATGWQTMWRRTGQMLLTLWTATATMVVLADPQGGSVTFGEGNIGRIENGTTVINQLSDRISIDWESFNVGVDERVVFQQPSSSATALNRIFDQNPSQIFGAIDANGRILLLNPNGILFGETAQVNIQSLVASSLELSLEDFKSGNYDLTALANSHGSAIINHGLIQAASGGSVSLVGDTVVNSGVIVAEYGQVNLAAGRQATVDFDGDGLLLFAVDAQVTENEQEIDNAVLNTGKIIADGGQVLMAANTAQDVFSNVVNNTGKVRAMRIDNSGGVVRLIGSGGTVSHSGQIDVSSDDGTGGLVEMTSERVGLFGSAHIDASGRDGGGVVHIGGGVQGGDESIKNADYTYVSQDAIVRADATEKGDGGEVVIWSEIGTRVHGELSARGGADGGDGGFVETSGKLGLVVANTPDVTAEHGDGGEWLIDPFDITIIDGNAPGVGIGNVNPFVSTATATIGAQLIADALGGGMNVSVTTGGIIGDGEGNGDITLVDGATLNFDGGDGGTLTFVALNDIIIDGIIRDSGGSDESLNLVFTATNNILINATGSIDLGTAGTFLGTAVSFTNAGTLRAEGGAIGIGLTLDGDFTNTGTLNAGATAIAVAAGTGGDATLTIGGTLTGVGQTYTGGLGADQFTLSAVVDGSLLGGNGNDVFTLIGSGAATLIDGQGATDRLVGANDINVWMITADQEGMVDGQNFVRVESLTGGTAMDTFTINANLGGTVSGGLGNDVFTLNGTVTGPLNGNDGNDSFTVLANGVASAINGNAGTDTLTVDDGDDNNWMINTANTGVVDGLAFNDVENLTGGPLVDNFMLSAVLDGNVLGGDGNDVFTLIGSGAATLIDGQGATDRLVGANDINVWMITADQEGMVDGQNFVRVESLTGGTAMDTFTINANLGGTVSGGLGNDVFTLNGTVTGPLNGNDGNDSFTVLANGVASAINGNAGTDTLTVDDGDDNNWMINTANTGVVDGLAFNDVENLTGGALIDTFTINANLGGTVSGGLGNDVFTLNGTVTGPLNGNDGNDSFTVLANGVASAINGNAGTDTLTVDDGDDNNWMINTANTGVVDGLAFNDVENLTGGALVDNFMLSAVLDGNVLGGDGNDVFTLIGSGAATLIDGQGATDRLVGANDINVWMITADQEGMVDGQNFVRVESLTGGTAMDTFTINANLGGTVSGGLGNDVFTLNGTVTGPLNGNDGNDSFTVLANGVASAINGNAGTDTLTVDDGDDNNWMINTANTGVVDGLAFNDVENLTGGALVDNFMLSAVLDGNLLGGNGNDVFTLIGSGAATLIDGQGATDRLVGANDINVWMITADQEGMVDGQNFVRVESLTGGTAMDTFTINANLGGTVSGGLGNDVFTLNGTVTGPLNGNDGNDSFTVLANGVASAINGNAGTDTLTVDDGDDNNWMINTANTGVVDGLAFNDVENLTGGPLVDNFLLSAVLDGNLLGGNGDDVFTLSGSGAASTIEGDGGSDTLVGANTVNLWTIDTDNGGSVGLQGFVNIENVTGGTMMDTFDISANLSGDVLGGAGNDLFDFAGNFTVNTIDGGDDSDTVDLADQTGAITVTLAGPLSIYTAIESFIGNGDATLNSGGGDDEWFVDALTNNGTVALDGATPPISFSAFTTLDAGMGLDSQLGPDQDVTWTVDINNTLVSQSFTYLPITSIEQFEGGSGIDIFNIDNTFNGSIGGGDGNDTFHIDAAVTGSLSGGLGDDVFNIDAAVSGDISGGIGNDDFNLNAGGMANLIDGNGGTDTLTGNNALMNTWTIDMLNSGMVNTQAFSNIENLIGGALVDIFSVNAMLDGSITGGDGDNQYNIAAVMGGNITGGIDIDEVTLIGTGSVVSVNGGAGLFDTLEGSSTMDNSWAMQTPTTGTLNMTTAYSNVEAIIGGAMNDTLIGSDTNNTWLVDLTNAGSLNNLAFSEIENLSGGSDIDDFSIIAQLDGNIAGNGGMDLFDLSGASAVGGDVSGGDDNDDMDIGGTVAGNVSGGAGNDAIDIDGGVTGNVFGDGGNDTFLVGLGGFAADIDGGSDSDSLAMENSLNNTWVIDSPNAGIVAGQTFLAIENLIGNNLNDTFVMQMTGAVESIDGGDGTDTLTGSDDQMNVWSVLAMNAGDLNGAAFSNIENLNGGALIDEFSLENVLSGNLVAGGGNDIITLAGGSAMLIDGGNGIDTLTGSNMGNTWVVNALNAGTVNITQAFTGVENLSGGSDIDTFNIDAQIDGNLSGNGSADVFNLGAASVIGGDVSGGDDADIINVDGAVAGFVLGGAGTDNILISPTGSASLFDGGADADTLTYANNLPASTDWIINADNAGSVNLQMFNNVENLVGGDAVIDTFTFAAAVSIGSIEGGTGTGDVLAGSNNFNVWNVTAGNAGQLNSNAFTGIEHLNGGTETDIFTLSAILDGNITGGDGADNFAFQGTGAAASIDGGADTDSIFGGNDVNTWAITSANSGTLNNQDFINVENLTGGTEVDTFNITASLDGDINGMDGADSFVLAGAGAAANIDGGSGSDSLTASDTVNVWTVSATNGGMVNTQDFANIENLSGGSMADTFNVMAPLDGAISGGGEADIFNLGAAVIGDINGDGGDDTFVLEAGGSANNLDGGNGIDTLVGDNAVNVWTVTTANSGTLNMQAFSNIENLTGGDLMDTFDVNAQVGGDITGGAGDDSFTLTGAGAANSLDGGAGNDTLNGDDIVNMWLVSGTNSGTVNTQAFMNVETLSGGEEVDTFTVNAQLDGNISGNGGADFVTTGALSLVGGNISGDAGVDTISIGGTVVGAVSGGDDNDAITIAGAVSGNVTGDDGDDAITVNANGAAPMIAGGAGNDTLTYATMVDNTWTIDAENAGTVNAQIFTGFENLTGGAQIDTFNINAGIAGNIDGGLGNDVFILSDQAAVTVGGVISGNDGNDTLSTVFLGGDRVFTYDGGAGTDAFLVSGNVVADYTGVFDAATGGLTYTAGAGVQQAILSNLESVSDLVLADSLQINSVVDVTLGAGTVAGQNPLNAMMGTLDFGFANKSNLDLNALTAGAGVSLVGAITLPGTLDIDLGAGGTLMSDQGLISADSLIIRNAQVVSNLATNVGSMMLDMVSGMFTVDETDELELLSSDVNGSLTVNAGGALTVADGETVNSSNNLTLTSATNVSIDGNVSADNLAITANNMQLNGNVTGSTSANLNAGSITQGATGQLDSGSLTTTTTAGMSLLGNNAISTLNATNMGGDLVVNNASTSIMNITNSGGLVDINNAGNLTISGLTNNLATSVDSTNLTIAGNITTTGAAATTLTGSGAVMQNAVVSAVGDLFINGNTINVASTTNAQSSGGNIAYNGMGDVTVNDITARNGSVLIASQMGDIFAAKTESAITSDTITFLGNGLVGVGVTPFAVFSTDGMLMLESPTDTNPNIDLFINEFGKFTTTGVRAINQRDLRAFATTSVFGQSLSSALSTGTDIDSNVFNIEQPDIVVPIGHGVTIPCGQIEDEEEACK